VNDAVPLELRTAVPRTVAPSIKDTEPEGTAVFAPLLIETWKVTEVAANDGLTLDVSVVDVRCRTG
jgi:hypothetical protein